MTHKTYTLTTAVLFLVIAVLHALRLAYGWTAVLGGWTVPAWLSLVALVVAAYLAWQGFKLGKK